MFPIRDNLRDFAAACNISEDWTTDCIWIDQICIDQGNNVERCHQVSQMVNLYAPTKATILWPGALPTVESDHQGSSLAAVPHRLGESEFEFNQKCTKDLPCSPIL